MAERNERGDHFIEFAEAHQMITIVTHFRKPNIK